MAQGTVADILNGAVVELIEREEAEGWTFLLAVHDSVYVMARPGSENDIAEVMERHAASLGLTIQTHSLITEYGTVPIGKQQTPPPTVPKCPHSFPLSGVSAFSSGSLFAESESDEGNIESPNGKPKPYQHEHVCDICGESFTGHGKAKRCSDDCKAEALKRWHKANRAKQRKARTNG